MSKKHETGRWVAGDLNHVLIKYLWRVSFTTNSGMYFLSITIMAGGAACQGGGVHRRVMGQGYATGVQDHQWWIPDVQVRDYFPSSALQTNLLEARRTKGRSLNALKDIVIGSQKLRVGRLKTLDPAGRCCDQADDLQCKKSQLPRRDQERRRQDWLGYQ